MATPKKPRQIDPADASNRQVLREREKRLEAARKPIPDLGLNLKAPEPENAAEFLADEWDRKTFGDAPVTTKRISYGPDPLFDGNPKLKAQIEKYGLHDYAEATAKAIILHGATALPDAVLQAGLAKAISKFGVEKVAAAFADRIMRIPCREVEYEVDRDTDYSIVGSRVLDDAVARYGRPGMAFKFLSERCLTVLGMRGYSIVKDENGDPVKIGTLLMGEISERIAIRRREHYANEAAVAVENEVSKYEEEAERLASLAGQVGRGSGPLGRGELVTGNASETQDFVGQTRAAGFQFEEHV